jgi:hypothetical protein
MPTQTEHEREARENEAFFQSLDKAISRNRKWMVTALFYAALHWAEALFANQLGLHVDSHQRRERSLHRLRFPLLREYIQLHDASRAGRYQMVRFSKQDVDDLFHACFVPIRNHILNALHPPAPTP